MCDAPSFEYRADALCCEGVPLADVVAAWGTPTYVYSAHAMVSQVQALDAALAAVPHRLCYAVKTNSNLAVLATFARAGVGFDIVSGGELARLQQVKAPMAGVVFAGVGKTAAEMHAALVAGIDTFNVESLPEAAALSACALAAGRAASVALRVNPEVEAGAHHYISTGTGREKFGVPLADAGLVYREIAALPGLVVRGLHAHIGSQILDMDAFARAARQLAGLTRGLRAAGFAVESLNLGGGLGIRYRDEDAPAAAAFAAAVLPEVLPLGVELRVEPGRFLVGNAGVLLARVLYRKQSAAKQFVVLDTGMNDLVRPSLYGAEHEILPLRRDSGRALERADLVGPLCEAGDFLARDRRLPALLPGEVVAICSAGAYGFAMSSNYNSRPRAAEVLVRDGAFQVVRKRETYDDLLRGETAWLPEANPG